MRDRIIGKGFDGRAAAVKLNLPVMTDVPSQRALMASAEMLAHGSIASQVYHEAD